jgi:hypothetical protein
MHDLAATTHYNATWQAIMELAEADFPCRDASPRIAGQGIDQRAASHHRGQHIAATNDASRLMCHSV